MGLSASRIGQLGVARYTFWITLYFLRRHNTRKIIRWGIDIHQFPVSYLHGVY